jgi:hypothetical protein
MGAANIPHAESARVVPPQAGRRLTASLREIRGRPRGSSVESARQDARTHMSRAFQNVQAAPDIVGVIIAEGYGAFYDREVLEKS